MPGMQTAQGGVCEKRVNALQRCSEQVFPDCRALFAAAAGIINCDNLKGSLDLFFSPLKIFTILLFPDFSFQPITLCHSPVSSIINPIMIPI